MSPFFSVIIPVYNVAPYLRECLDSVRNQTYGNWEAICVDDGSTDGSGEILDSYNEIDARIIVIHKDNAGVGEARNTALRISSGEWILFLDGDDLFRDTTLKRLYDYVKDFKNVQMVSFNTIRFSTNDELHWPDKDVGDCKVEDTSIRLNKIELYSHFAGKMYHRGIVPYGGFKGLTRGEDLIFLAESVCQADGVLTVKDSLYAYRMRNGSATHSSMSSQVFKDMRTSIPMLFSIYKKSGKRLLRSEIQSKYRLMTSGFISRMLTMHKDERPALWGLWYDMLDEISKTERNLLTVPQKTAIWVMRRFRFPMFAELVFAPVSVAKNLRREFRFVLNRWMLHLYSHGAVRASSLKEVFLIGRPLIECCKGGRIVLGERCLLKSCNKGYHANLYAPVKLKVSRPGAVLSIGDDTRIYGSAFNCFQSIKVGRSVLIAGNCQVFDANGHLPSWGNLGERKDSKDDGKPIIIEDYVWIGTGTIILPGVRIGKGSIIGAGSVVVKDVPPMCVAAGNPAKVVRRIAV